MKLSRNQWRDLFDTAAAFALPAVLLLIVRGVGACPIVREVLR